MNYKKQRHYGAIYERLYWSDEKPKEMDVLHVYLIQNMKTICKGFENMQTIYETNEKNNIKI